MFYMKLFLNYTKIILINFLVFIFGLILLEIVFIVYLKSSSFQNLIELPSFLKSYVTFKVADIIQNKEDCAKYDKELFYTLKPGNCIFNLAESSESYSINSLGVRDDENSLIQPEIIFLGDSFTMGWGVSNEETYVKILENNSKKKILNAGIASYGTAREMGLLKRIDTSKLNYLIVQYCPNDFEENLSYIQNGYKLNVSSEEKYNELVNLEKKKSEYFFGKHLIQIYKELKSILFSKIHENKLNQEYSKLTKDFVPKKLEKVNNLKTFPFGEIEVEFDYTNDSKNFLHLHGWANGEISNLKIASFSFFINAVEVPVKFTKEIERLDLVSKLNLVNSTKIGWSAEILLPNEIDKDLVLDVVVKDTEGKEYFIQNKNKKKFILKKTKINEAETFLKILSSEKKQINENTKIILISLFDYLLNPPDFLQDVEKLKSDKKYPKYINNLKVIPVQEFLNKENFLRIDKHINPTGHKIVAEKILEQIK